MKESTDKSMGAVLCGTCGTLLNAADADGNKCPVCGSVVHQRNRDSLQKTWAYLLTAVLFYIPANLLPVMNVEVLGKISGKTILGGVLDFISQGQLFIAAVVFVASFVVPILKIAVMFYLLVTLNKSCFLSKRFRTKMFLFVEQIGKWSMLDVFVVAITSGLVNASYKLDVSGGLGIVFFALVVVLTMRASANFDTRFLWDKGA